MVVDTTVRDRGHYWHLRQRKEKQMTTHKCKTRSPRWCPNHPKWTVYNTGGTRPYAATPPHSGKSERFHNHQTAIDYALERATQ